MQIAINGFGRIGRAAFRILYERQKAGQEVPQVVAINDLTDAATLAHLLQYDSVHGKFEADVSINNGALLVDGQSIAVHGEADPSKLPWGDSGVSVVLEATGRFLDRDLAAQHLAAGAQKVLISAPAKGKAPDATVCFGINDSDITSDMQVISTASCTTNCLAPLASLLHQNFGIAHGLMTTVHAYTNDQRILDLPHKDLRRARAAGVSMIPTTTGAAKALALVLPEMAGRLDGMAIRVPTPCVSLVDLVINLEKETTAEAINSVFSQAAAGPLEGILGYSEAPLVSTDYVGTRCSSIVDALSTKVIGGKTAKVLAWYDNEWGFTNRAVDLLGLLAKAG
ncbi:MAG: type I glyceraldehyde-3-phosphate dehydrogenase [Myxococcales bacterium]|nr:type I glyceraldehyde-3-phosphate dehydrogenase [Myxococcales bacterium]